jgi:hypothetical protein
VNIVTNMRVKPCRYSHVPKQESMAATCFTGSAFSERRQAQQSEITMNIVKPSL